MGLIFENLIRRFGAGKTNAAACESDPALRDFENVPLKVDVDGYFEREVRPHVPDLWMDRSAEPVPDLIDGRFLAYFLTLPVGRSQVEVDARGTSAFMVRISRIGGYRCSHRPNGKLSSRNWRSRRQKSMRHGLQQIER